MNEYYLIEEIFKSGFDAGQSSSDADGAWEKFRYDMLFQHEGKAVADVWLEERKKLTHQPILDNVKCPNCGGEMTPRNGQFGKFWGCKKYPNCRGTHDSMGRSKAERTAEKGEEYKGEDGVTPTNKINEGYTFRKN